MKTIEIKEKIITSLTAQSAGNIIPLFTRNPYIKLGYRVLHESLEIKNLQVRSFINALPVVPFPTFPLEASESETQLQILKLEWQGARIQANLLIKNELVDWIRVGMVSLLNASPAPYREFPLGDHQLGNDAMLGLQIQNVGYGLLQGQDRANITADLIRHVTLEKISDGNKINAIINSNTATQVIPPNVDRSGITVFNNSNTDVFLDITSVVSSQSFLIKIPSQAYYESGFPITDAIYMISLSGAASVHVREFN
ncbi:MAG TPA: hypothetical protein VE956_13635 [Nodularia sp. (in: cyanobacteria)]|nr:hypothetical protein [Nodularia sp. (in: cyanobacteria)]